MSRYTFVFDLDSTITKREVLPLIASLIDKESELETLTFNDMNKKKNFKSSFLKRVEMLKNIDVSLVQDLVCKIELNELLVNFIQNNRDNCCILTGNLDVWIEKLIKKINPRNCFSSRVSLHENKIQSVDFVVNKLDIIKTLPRPIVAIGDGSNDIEMIDYADIGIAFSNTHPLSNEIISVADYCFDDENKLYDFLSEL